MIEIICNSQYLNEKKYIYDVLFKEFMGIEYKCIIDDNICDEILLKMNGIIIKMPSVLFSISEEFWLQELSMPVLPLEVFYGKELVEKNFYNNNDLAVRAIPVIYGKKNNGDFIKINDDFIYFGIDIFGSCFFMLTRYEEIVIKNKDKFGRFRYEDSVAFKENFLNRPIVNEYVEILCVIIKNILPDLEIKKRNFKLIPTHDIDRPFGMKFENSVQIIRHFIGDIVLRKNPEIFFCRFKELVKLIVNENLYIKSKYEVYKFIYNINKKYGLKSYFFFMNSKHNLLDGNYKINNKIIINLIRDIQSQNQYIGIHPSYDSYNSKDLFDKEVNCFKHVLKKFNLNKICGGRQHYLRWDNPTTWKLYDDAGITFDSTMTFAGCVGFRCGTCYEYTLYNLLEHKQLKLKEKPLIVMDGTLFEYMKLNKVDAMKVVIDLANKCKTYNGDFVILWHNTTLENKEEREFYVSMIERILKDG